MVTLKHVAEHAGVSQATASLVLNGRDKEMKVSAQSAQRVRDAAHALGYHGNYHARSLSTGRTLTLGLVLSPVQEVGISNRFWGPVVAGISDAAHEHDYNLLLINPACVFENYEHAMSFIETRRVDALIVIGHLFGAPETPPVPRPTIVSIHSQSIAGCPVVDVDRGAGIRDAVAHLASLGHREILLIIRAVDGQPLVPERLPAFRDATAEHGITGHVWLPEIDVDGHAALDDQIELYRSYLSERLRLGPTTTAILCWNDTMGLALYSVLRDRGLRVPEDISVVGFDDLYAAHAIPAMTTVSHMLHEMGETAAAVAFDLLKNPAPDAAPQTIRIPSRLIVRASTAAPREA